MNSVDGKISFRIREDDVTLTDSGEIAEESGCNLIAAAMAAAAALFHSDVRGRKEEREAATVV